MNSEPDNRVGGTPDQPERDTGNPKRPKFPLERHASDKPPEYAVRQLGRNMPDLVKALSVDRKREIRASFDWIDQRLATEFPPDASHTRKWDGLRATIRYVAWSKLRLATRTALGNIETYEQAYNAVCRARALWSSFDAPKLPGPDARGFPDRVRKLVGDNIREFIEAEPKLFVDHEKKVQCKTARERQALRSKNVDASEVNSSVISDLLVAVSELETGKWPSRTPFDVTCASPKLPDRGRKKIRETDKETGREKITRTDHIRFDSDLVKSVAAAKEVRVTAAAARDAVAAASAKKEALEIVAAALQRVRAKSGRSRARAFAADTILEREAGATLVELARRAGLKSEGTLSDAYQWVREQLSRDPTVRALVA